ncbi:MAG: YafY family protein [Clostridiaceae bacterium]|nr:YafY family transcriptional regulator [Eubacteriales bacterium]
MKLSRQLGILTVLLKNERITAPYLAEKFEVSRRTINRDVESLCMAGIPIVSKQGGGGGFSIAEGYKLENSALTTEELSAILAALRGIGSVSEKTSVARALDKLSPKDGALLPEESLLIDLASHYKESLTEKIARLQTAIRERRVAEFDYYSEKGVERRRIELYRVAFQWTSWYAFGYCLEREDFRMFKLARLWELKLSDDTFSPRDISRQKLDFNARFPDETRFTALFHPSVKHLLVEQYGPHCYTETESGMLLFEGGYTLKGHTIAWLLGFGAKAKALAPKELVSELAKAAKEMAALYEGT